MSDAKPLDLGDRVAFWGSLDLTEGYVLQMFERYEATVQAITAEMRALRRVGPENVRSTSPEALDRRHGDTGGRLLSDDEDPIPGVRERKGAGG